MSDQQVMVFTTTVVLFTESKILKILLRISFVKVSFITAHCLVLFCLYNKGGINGRVSALINGV